MFNKPHATPSRYELDFMNGLSRVEVSLIVSTAEKPSRVSRLTKYWVYGVNTIFVRPQDSKQVVLVGYPGTFMLSRP